MWTVSWVPQSGYLNPPEISEAAGLKTDPTLLRYRRRGHLSQWTSRAYIHSNLPQEEGIQTVYKAYVSFYQNEIPILTPLLERALRLILSYRKIPSNLMEKTIYRHTATPWVLKWQLPLPTFSRRKLKQMSGVSQNVLKQLVWKRYDDQKLQKTPRKHFIQNTLSEVNFEDRKLALQQKRRENKWILPL